MPVLFCGARAMVLNVRSDSARCAATTFHLLRSALAMLLLMVHYSMLWTAATTYDDARRASVHGTIAIRTASTTAVAGFLAAECFQ